MTLPLSAEPPSRPVPHTVVRSVCRTAGQASSHPASLSAPRSHNSVNQTPMGHPGFSVQGLQAGIWLLSSPRLPPTAASDAVTREPLSKRAALRLDNSFWGTA